MPCICRLIKLSPEQATFLVANHENLAQSVDSSKIYTDVYRYWHAIQYLLSHHQPKSVAVNWLNAGQAVSTSINEIPSARVIFADQVQQINAAIQDIEPDDLIPDYDADMLDAAGVYPQCWQKWEETFDPLGQVLEHYWFLKQFVSDRAAAADALLLYFEFNDDGSDDFD